MAAAVPAAVPARQLRRPGEDEVAGGRVGVAGIAASLCGVVRGPSLGIEFRLPHRYLRSACSV